MDFEVTESRATEALTRSKEASGEGERRNQRRLKAMMQLLLATIRQDRSLTVEDAAQMVAQTRDAALRLFPGRETAYNVLWRPHIQRAMRERFQIQ
jgi:hypothetical protein